MDMKNGMKRETIIGLACFSISMGLTQFDPVPAFITGALTGCGLLLIFIGLLPQKTYDALRNWKKKLFHIH